MNITEIAIGGRKKVCPDDIILMKADVNYSVLYLTNGSKIIVATTLKTLEARFSQCMFFRTDKSYLINLRYVLDEAEYYPHDISLNNIQLQNDFTVKISRRKKIPFLGVYESLQK